MKPPGITVKCTRGSGKGSLLLRTFSLLLLLLFSPFLLSSPAAQTNWSGPSVLQTGNWFRLKVTEKGIYRLSWEELKNIGFSDPSTAAVYSNNQGQLSYSVDTAAPRGLVPVSVWFEKGDDGVFNRGDYMLFYAEGSDRWEYKPEDGFYEYHKHAYSDTAFYFLTGDHPGREISLRQNAGWEADYESAVYDGLWVWEKDEVNLMHSGRDWYEPLVPSQSKSMIPDPGEIISGSNLKYRLRVAARSPVITSFRLQYQQQLLENFSVNAVYIERPTSTFALNRYVSGSLSAATGEGEFSLTFYPNGSGSSRGWLDYLMINARCHLQMQGTPLVFADSRTTGEKASRFSLRNSSPDTRVWDVTNPFRPEELQTQHNGQALRFTDSTQILKTYIAFEPGMAATPAVENKPMVNQNLQQISSADYLIITHPLFRPYAEELAEIHREHNNLQTTVVEPKKIYNEYSSGMPDVSAIRNFVRDVYVRSQSSDHPLRYLLLFGNGSFENKTPPPGNTSYILTYQSQNSTIPTQSFVTDDFFGLLEEGEGEATGNVDIGIGRLPVSDTLEARIMISKIKRYLSEEAHGPWRNTICMIGDDEDGNDHMEDAEQLSAYISTEYEGFTLDKIYLDAFPQVITARGQSYPAATKAINNRIENGALIVNYLGHGNELGLAHERVLKIEDINSWNNREKMPLFITATCEFSRFDDVEIQGSEAEITDKKSAGEMVLLQENGGSIGLLTTTRLVYSAPNYLLNRRFYEYAFRRDENGRLYRLGDLIRLAKNTADQGINKRNFTLLGDPALRLAYPAGHTIVTDSVNNQPAGVFSDTLKALQEATINGHVEYPEGGLNKTFNGTMSVRVYDKASVIQTLSNDGDPVMDFELQNNLIYQGNATVTAGYFSFSFLVPKDINYQYGPGKINYYVVSDEQSDGQGYFSDFTVGGFSDISNTDTTGPDIRLYLNDTLFREGGRAGIRPELFAVLSDPSGINTVGSGIGHDLVAVLDSNTQNPLVLNNYYESAADDYTRGTLRFQLEELEPGNHSLQLKAWDNLNNSSAALLEFTVAEESGFQIFDLMNYPNPFRDETSFVFGHNRPGQMIYIRIAIYNRSGILVHSLNSEYAAGGYRMAPVRWNGRTDTGQPAGSGFYFYRITATTPEGEKTQASGKLIKLF